MTFDRYMKYAAVLAVVALAACSGGGSSSYTPANSTAPPAPQGGAILSRIVGVGDSLTAGEQANGTMGVSYTGNPNSALPGGLVPATQTNGFFALFYEQATGMTVAQMASPATSVLPLISAPGNGQELVVTAPPSPFAATQLACSTFNLGMYVPSAVTTVRANPTTVPFDLGVPGLTMHEALTMSQPITGAPQAAVGTTCPGYPTLPGDPTSGAFQTLVGAESSTFYPVLGNFNGLTGVQPVSEISAAQSLHPTLATVWLGANDVIKFSGSAGQAPVDTPTQMQSDLTTIIQRLQAGGAKVVVANLPDILSTPQYFQGGAALATSFNTLSGGAISIPVGTLVASNIQTKYGVSSAGYLTLSGFLSALAQVAGGNVSPVLDPTTAGSGIGAAYLPDAFAAEVQGLNTAYNASIAAAAAATNTPLVDVHAIFVGIKTGTGPYAALAAVNPPKCCNLAYGGGLVSWDGLHPSNTGYALIANAWIATVNAAYGTTIPTINVAAVYNGTAPYGPLPDPYARH